MPDVSFVLSKWYAFACAVPFFFSVADVCLVGLVCSFAMHSNVETLYKSSGWPGVEGGSRLMLMDKLHGMPMPLNPL